MLSSRRLKALTVYLLVAVCIFITSPAQSQQVSQPDQPNTQTGAGPNAGPPAPSANIPEPQVYVDLLDPKTVHDTFGTRIAKRFVVLQVTISNTNPDFQYLIHDVSLDLSEVVTNKDAAHGLLKILYTDLDALRARRTAAIKKTQSSSEAVAETNAIDAEILATKKRYRFNMSSVELGVLRGVAERGQQLDARNFVYRILRGVGTIAASMLGITTFGSAVAPSIALFNGPGLSAYTEALPDFTINQMNRLNDLAYRSNTLVPRQQAKVMVAFLPQALFMDKKMRHLFYKDPVSTFDYFEFRHTAVVVKGAYITEIANLPLRLTVIQISDDEVQKFQNVKPEVKGSVRGHGLKNATLELVSPSREFAKVSVDGTSTDDRLDFTLKLTKPVLGRVVVTFQVVGVDGTASVLSKEINYSVEPTTIDANQSYECTTDDKKCTITIKGQHFPAALKADAFMFKLDGLKVGSVSDITDTTTALHIDTTGIPAGTYELRMNGVAGVVKFGVKAKPAP